eukprot:jgi/Tetstr1/436052/TSEL_024930.t1
MEAARREAPVDIHRVSRALDGHHGIPVLNVPLGSAGYVHAYMRGKAEELQEEAGYWLRNCLPSKVEAFAEAVDDTVLTSVERVLDPSTYGTDTNPVIIDCLPELLHDHDPIAT